MTSANRAWHFLQIIFWGENVYEMSNPVLWENLEIIQNEGLKSNFVERFLCLFFFLLYEEVQSIIKGNVWDPFKENTRGMCRW